MSTFRTLVLIHDAKCNCPTAKSANFGLPERNHLLHLWGVSTTPNPAHGQKVAQLSTEYHRSEMAGQSPAIEQLCMVALDVEGEYKECKERKHGAELS